MKEIALKEFGSGLHNLTVVGTYDEKDIGGSINWSYEVTCFNGDMRWNFYILEDAIELANALAKGFEKCYEFNID